MRDEGDAKLSALIDWLGANHEFGRPGSGRARRNDH